MKKYAFAFSLLLLLASCKKDDLAHNSNENTRIEEVYEKDGSQAVSSKIVQDRTGANAYKIFYPSNMTAKTPLITWGNGSNTNPENYTEIFTHLASWGFIVVDTYVEHVGDGTKIMDAVNYMLQQNNDPQSVFYQKVDRDRIAAVGGSQGAVGIVNAFTNHPDGRLLKTLVPIAYTSYLANTPEQVTVPIFFISGTNDAIVSTYTINKTAYDKLPQGVPAVLGMRIGAVHEEIGRSRSQFGYLTAWLQYQLKGDLDAGAAFRGADAELLRNENWEKAATKNLP